VAETLAIAEAGAEGVRSAFDRRIRDGGVVVFPADTLYGLACDPLDAGAIDRIHALKGRDEGKSSAVMFFSPLSMRGVVATLGSRTRDALDVLLAGPVTVIVHNPERCYPLACREDPNRLGLRLIEGPLSGAATAAFQTSANRSGEPAPSRFADVDPAIASGADLAIDGGELRGEPSTVVDLTGLEEGGGWQVLRAGAVAEREIARRLAAIAG
jgi:L-threonylcarbamoyladenylate synthase